MENRLKNNTKRLFLGFAGTMFLCSTSCSEINEGIDYPTSVYYEASVGTPTGAKVSSLGAELDPHFLSQNVTRSDGAKASDWDMVVDRVTRMNLQSLRVMVLPEWFEPLNDDADPANINWAAMTFESQEMQSLYKVLDMAQTNDIEVTLVMWGCATNARLLDPAYSSVKIHFLATGNSGNWVVAPNNDQEWSENFSALVQYLINTKKYTCVKEITPINEPDWSYYVGSSAANTSAQYIAMCKVLDARFKTDGIRDKVRFNLADNSDGGSGTTAFLQKCTEALADVADVFNSHTYIFGYDTPNSTILNWEKANCQLSAAAGKKHFLGEFGSNQTVGSSRQADIDLYKRGVLMSRIVLNVLNAGGTGVSYWGLLDQYYNRDAQYSEMQQLGMWKYVKQAYSSDAEVYNNIKADYEVRPQYYAYSMLTRFINPGMDVYPIDLGEDLITSSAFKGENGKWIYVFANGTAHNKPVGVNGQSGCDGEYDLYKYVENQLPSDDRMIASSEVVKISGGKLSVTLPRQSVMIYVQK